MNPDTEVRRLLSEFRANLVRSRKHEVWKLPNGHTYVRASTPSDFRAADNQLTDLRRQLGIADPKRGKTGERREHKHGGRDAKIPQIQNEGGRGSSTLQEQLSASGIVEARLRNVIFSQGSVMAAQRREIAKLHTLRKSCWGCRLLSLWRRLTCWVKGE